MCNLKLRREKSYTKKKEEPTREPAELFGEFEGLEGQVAGGGEDESPDGALGEVLLEAVEHGDEEGCGLAGAGAGHGDDVGAGEDEGHGLALDGGGDGVALALDPSEHVGTQIHGLESTRLALPPLLLPPLQLRLGRSSHGHLFLLESGHGGQRWGGGEV